MDHDNILLFLSSVIFVFSVFGILTTYNSFSSFGELAGFSVYNARGQINVSINENVLVNFSVSNINFGSGYVYSSAQFASLDTLGNVVNGSWIPVNQGFVVSNIGNVNVTLNLSSGKSAVNFIGGSNPLYQYNITNLNSSSCIPPADFNLNTFYNMSVGPDSKNICDVFSVGKNLRIDLLIRVPYNSYSGNLTDYLSLTVSKA